MQKTKKTSTAKLQHVILRDRFRHLDLSQQIVTRVIPLYYSGALWERFTTFKIASLINILILFAYLLTLYILFPFELFIRVFSELYVGWRLQFHMFFLTLWAVKLWLFPFRYVFFGLILVNFAAALFEVVLEKSEQKLQRQQRQKQRR